MPRSRLSCVLAKYLILTYSAKITTLPPENRMLKAIELAGFKSFANRTRLEFGEGITGIVGPNGSGKSNIVDAIKWVLGEQSMKKLRSNDSTDVIRRCRRSLVLIFQ